MKRLLMIAFALAACSAPAEERETVGSVQEAICPTSLYCPGTNGGQSFQYAQKTGAGVRCYYNTAPQIVLNAPAGCGNCCPSGFMSCGYYFYLQQSWTCRA